MTDLVESRKAFEAWAENNNIYWGNDFRRDGDGYAAIAVDRAWLAWIGGGHWALDNVLITARHLLEEIGDTG